VQLPGEQLIRQFEPAVQVAAQPPPLQLKVQSEPAHCSLHPPTSQLKVQIAPAPQSCVHGAAVQLVVQALLAAQTASQPACVQFSTQIWFDAQ
jgi:hypothetical protein